MAEYYYVYTDGVVRGPFSLKTLSRMLQDRQIDGTTPISGGPGTPWQTVDDYPAIRQTANAAHSPAGNAVAAGESTVIFYCPECRQKYSGDAGYLGKDIICVSCQKTFTVRVNSDCAPIGIAAEAPTTPWLDSGNIICPHCWLHFNSEDLLYIAEHPALNGDPVLGSNAMHRFAPIKFNALGQVLDDMGQVARQTACPRCHLPIPDTVIDEKSLYISVVGAPASGKSYYLATLLHTLRQRLADNLACTLTDVDPEMNWVLNHYEETIFRPLHRNEVAVLPKTQQTGDAFVNTVNLNNMQMLLPQPFIYELKFFAGNSNCNLVLYDNAGEQFAPGADNISNPGTRHLACSNGIVFIFDPLNDAIMRQFCDPREPQLQTDKYIYEQTRLLSEMIFRIRRHRNMTLQEKCSIPLVLAVGKFDAWQSLLKRDLTALPLYLQNKDNFNNQWCRNSVMDVSFTLRELLLQYAPELIHTAESFFRNVAVVPCSNFGCHSSRSASGQLGVIPEQLRPLWVEAPLLYILNENGVLASEPYQPAAAKVLPTRQLEDFLIFEHPVHHHPVRLPVNYSGSTLTIEQQCYTLSAGSDDSSSGTTCNASAPQPVDIWS